jgi:hypothetical protein
MADEWVWPPLAMGDVSCGPGAEEAEAFITICSILGMGLERSLWFPLRYK